MVAQVNTNEFVADALTAEALHSSTLREQMCAVRLHTILSDDKIRLHNVKVAFLRFRRERSGTWTPTATDFTKVAVLC